MTQRAPIYHTSYLSFSSVFRSADSEWSSEIDSAVQRPPLAGFLGCRLLVDFLGLTGLFTGEDLFAEAS